MFDLFYDLVKLEIGRVKHVRVGSRLERRVLALLVALVPGRLLGQDCPGVDAQLGSATTSPLGPQVEVRYA